jgi:hypothetical protein
MIQSLCCGALMFISSVVAAQITMPECKPDHSNAPCIVLPDAPTVKVVKPGSHPFFDLPNVMIFMGSASAISAEAAVSCSQPGPTQLSVKTCNQIAVGGALFLGGQALGAGVLHVTGHHTLERSITPAAILFHLGRIVWISTHRGR